MKVVAVIPARYSAQRLPGKPLADLLGKPMIQWVYEGAKRAQSPSQFVIATDDTRIQAVAQSFGARVVMTSSDIQSGTDRVAAVADQIAADVYVNVQGDEPLIEGEIIDQAVALVTSGRFRMATLMTPLQSLEELRSPHVVKVIADRELRAIYFSRHPIPYSRIPEPPEGRAFISRRHLGLYVYTRELLHELRKVPPCDLERAESLEQLRALEQGIAIGITEVKSQSIGVDLPEDLETVRNLLKARMR
jgi:3-deoxy-manno-octulosonate cytidylyltransferase (CMP-KDO synthetase)